MRQPAVLSLGSNVGDRLAWLRLAVDVIGPVSVSPVYESEPVGPVHQPDFLNAVVIADLGAAAAWQRAQEAEARAGRTRDVPQGPRTLDVDVVDAAGGVPGLVLPHPRAHERAFVLAPWADLDAAAVLPGHGSVAVLLAALLAVPGARVARRDDLVLRG